jgi:hypothetical protein
MVTYPAKWYIVLYVNETSISNTFDDKAMEECFWDKPLNPTSFFSVYLISWRQGAS